MNGGTGWTDDDGESRLHSGADGFDLRRSEADGVLLGFVERIRSSTGDDVRFDRHQRLGVFSGVGFEGEPEGRNQLGLVLDGRLDAAVGEAVFQVRETEECVVEVQRGDLIGHARVVSRCWVAVA